MKHFIPFVLCIISLVLTGCPSSKAPDSSEATGIASTSQFAEPVPDVPLPDSNELEKLGPLNDLDPKWIISDALFTAVGNPQRFLDSPLGKANPDLLNSFCPQLTRFPTDYTKLDRFVVSIAQAVIFVPETGPDGKPSMIPVPAPMKILWLHFAEPVSPEQFFKNALPLQLPFEKLLTKKVGELEYYDILASVGREEPLGVGIHFPDDRTAVVFEGPIANIATAFSGKPASGAAAERLRRIDLAQCDTAMIVTREGLIVSPNDMQMLFTAIQLPAPLVDALSTTRALTLTFDASAPEKESIARLLIDSLDSEGAQSVTEQIQGWILSGRMAMIPENEGPHPPLPLPREFAAELLDAVQVAHVDQSAEVTLRMFPGAAEKFSRILEAGRRRVEETMIVEKMKALAQGFLLRVQDEKRFTPINIERPDGTPLLSWRVAILPYLGMKELFDRFKLDEPWDSPTNKTLLENMPPLFRLPKDPVEGPRTTFRIFNGEGTPFGKHDLQESDLMAARQTTALIVSVASTQAVEWTRPDVLTYDPAKLEELFGDTFTMLTIMGAGGRVALDQIPKEAIDASITGKVPKPLPPPPPSESSEPPPVQPTSQDSLPADAQPPL